ncbi:MAG: AAA family ATPase [Bryobacterales bacterium]|nr:AAA family ATPase [Bryobacterales bacterium]
MIRRIQALNYRCLRYVDVHLDGSFHILVGANASGKSTLLDVIGFLADLVVDDLDTAVARRTRNFQDLVWGRKGTNAGFELAVEFEIPEELRAKLLYKESEDIAFRFFQYEVAVQSGDDGLCIASEGGFLKNNYGMRLEQRDFDKGLGLAVTSSRVFPSTKPAPDSILTGTDAWDYRCTFQKSADGKDTFTPEVTTGLGVLGRSQLRFTFGKRRSALGNLPEDPELFPVSTYAKRILVEGVQKLFLDSTRLRRASSPNNRRLGFDSDGSNLPWAIQWLRESDPGKFTEWLGHIQTALRDVVDIRIVEREDDRHAYLMLRHTTGVEVPSWTVSDGTLRLLALTLTAYLPDNEKIYLMEEPENGIHPMAIETVYQSLSSIYESQVLVATHSPVFLGCAAPEEVLCFAKNEGGATDIIRGSQHPRLADWQSSADINLLFATEVLG